jgi:membrane associated rhomboid family serine protease
MLVILAIIALTCAVSIPCFNNRRLLDSLIFWPPAVARGEYYRLISHGFVHADGQHLLFNMITLFFFGRAVAPFFEREIGAIGFTLFYLAGIAVAILPSYLRHRHNPRYRSLGASGAVSAVLFTYILMAPWSIIYLFVFPVPAVVFAAAYTVYSFYAGRKRADNVNHSAHLWGAGYGVIAALVIEPRLAGHFLGQLLHP